MTQDICTIKLRNVGGVPVIEVIGVLNRAAVQTVEKTIGHLTSAGHYNIVLNVKRAMAANLSVLESLGDSIKRVREHYGSVELVAESEQIEKLSPTAQIFKLFKFCASEGQAFQRIKKLVRPDDMFYSAAAHLQESL